MSKEKCIKELLDEKQEDAKVGEFKKLAQAKLEELAGSVESEEQAYRAKLAEFTATWQEHEHRVCDLEAQIRNCYPKFEDYIKDVICDEVIDKIKKLKGKIFRNIGRPEWKLDRANDVLATAASQLDAWKNISKWIKSRLDANAALIEEVCKHDKCTERADRLCIIYIFFFELLPAHKQLEKPLDELPGEHSNPEEHWCSHCSDDDDSDDYHHGLKLCGYPWLIEPSDYDCKLADVWNIWYEAGVRQVKAQCDYDAIVACREELAIALKPETKRKNACAALREHEEKHQDKKNRNQSTAD